MNGLKTVMALTDKVAELSKDVDVLRSELRDTGSDLRAIDRRLIRVETIIEVTRSDGATLRIARDPE